MTTRVEITEVQYRQLMKTGVEVEVKYYLVATSSKTIAASKSKVKRRTPLTTYRLFDDWPAIAMPTEKSEFVAAAVAGVYNEAKHEAMLSRDLAERLAVRIGTSAKDASQWVGRMVERGVLVSG